MEELEKQNIVVCAWRFDTKVSAETYVDALDKLIYLAKKEMFDDYIKPVIDKWEILNEGNYKPKEIELWIIKDMKPVIDNLRKCPLRG